MIVCAGNGEDFAFAKSIGVGLVESAMRLSQICARESVDSIIFIGSAGAYSQNTHIFDVYIADSATQIELAFLQEQAYTPLDNHIQSDTLNMLVSHETLKTLPPKAVINSSNYITTDTHLAARLSAAGIMLENMEFFAVMSVAQYFAIPCVGIFCVSNYCHKDAHTDFINNHSRVKQILIEQSPLIHHIAAIIARRDDKPIAPHKHNNHKDMP
ncbi:purine-nucleoside phosphorylase [Helicobacter jaachi]|uniref:Purine-nucleoside phosphorylase n=1 Tax=Helicobacter jaachi TaxID=1677920 RepID=A0A4U8TBA5_9HELI|nr:purine-nucleoside phosphorylase [Helicobacter jaachi]TLD97200.1 purine-nucleoside phosphorylase [Helicobacter jaachi]